VTENLNNHTDSELLELYKKTSDSKYLGTLLNRYSLLVFGVCMKYLKDAQNAEDATQQVFEKVINEVKKYEIPYFKSWLYSVAKNQCLMQLRKSPNKPTFSDKEIEDIDIHAEEEQDLLVKEYLYEDSISLLKEALQKLNKEQELCIRLFYLEKFSYREIENKTGFSFQQIKSHIQNGKRNLRILLENQIDKNEI
jgi:RNA polymerase sigma-70 factor (ECF subfamily)